MNMFFVVLGKYAKCLLLDMLSMVRPCNSTSLISALYTDKFYENSSSENEV